MADLLAQSSAWLEAQRTRHMTRLVSYQRGAAAVDVAATVGETIFQIDDGAGALLRVESRDYLILTADLMLGGMESLPQRGDRIREIGPMGTCVYEVMAPEGEPHWRYSDPYRQTLRIHTKQVDTEVGGTP